MTRLSMFLALVVAMAHPAAAQTTLIEDLAVAGGVTAPTSGTEAILRMDVFNDGPTRVRIVAAETLLADKISLHAPDGAEIQGIDIDPGAVTRLGPNGPAYLKAVGLHGPLAPGAFVHLHLLVDGVGADRFGLIEAYVDVTPE